MFRSLVLSVAPLFAAFWAVGMQPPFRRRPQKWDRTLATEWISGLRVPGLAVLPTTGAIVEANEEARRLFLGRPLLEMDLFALLPTHPSAVLEGLTQAQQIGAACIPVTLNGVGLMNLVLSTPAPNHPLLVAMLLPAQPATEFRTPPSPTATFPPLTLPSHWINLPIEKQISLLLQEATEQWPVVGASVFRRRGMELIRLVTSIDNLSWDALDLPAVALGNLFHGGSAVEGKLGPQSILLYPLYLPSERQPWGAVALAPESDSATGAELTTATANIATTISLLLAQTRSQSGQETKNHKIRQLVTLRDHLLSRIRRGVLLLDDAGRIESINATASTMLGWPIEDVAGRPIAPLLDELGPLGEKIIAALQAPSTERQTASARLRPPRQTRARHQLHD